MDPVWSPDSRQVAYTTASARDGYLPDPRSGIRGHPRDLEGDLSNSWTIGRPTAVW